MAIIRRQGKGVDEALHGVRVGAAQALLQIAKAPHAQPSPLGQLLLGEPRRRALPPEQLTERGRPIGSQLSPLDSPPARLVDPGTGSGETSS